MTDAVQTQTGDNKDAACLKAQPDTTIEGITAKLRCFRDSEFLNKFIHE